MTVTESITIIEKLANKELMTELLYLRDELEREDGEYYDLLSAFEDAAIASGGTDCQHSYLMNIREIQIALGWYRVITEEELSRTICMSGNKTTKNYNFKHKGLKYVFASPFFDTRTEL